MFCLKGFDVFYICGKLIYIRDYGIYCFEMFLRVYMWVCVCFEEYNMDKKGKNFIKFLFYVW